MTSYEQTGPGYFYHYLVLWCVGAPQTIAQQSVKTILNVSSECDFHATHVFLYWLDKWVRHIDCVANSCCSRYFEAACNSID